jgi:DNA-binding HxlR family transcriptional regulator
VCTALCKQTALDLGLLQIHVPKETVNVLSSDWKPVVTKKYTKCFEGIGKLKNVQLKIPIDEHVTSVVQPIRRIPYLLREKLEKKLRELEQDDMIEKVHTRRLIL